MELIKSVLLKITLILRVTVLRKSLEDYKAASYLTIFLIYKISHLPIMRLIVSSRENGFVPILVGTWS